MQRSYLEHAMRDAARIEVRHHDGTHWWSGVFDNPHYLWSCVASLNDAGNTYTTINAPKLMAVTNDMTGPALRDADIGHLVRLPFDFDPVRGKGQPSNAEELALALARRDAFVQALRALGWPMPAMGMSGNGAHALFRWRVPNSPEFKEMLAALYRGMQLEFSTDQVLFDTTVRNAARIWRLYGSTNRKGAASADRPHRVAHINIPDRWSAVSPQLVERLANQYAMRMASVERQRVPVVPMRTAPYASGRGDYRTLAVQRWFAAHGAHKRHLGGGKHAVRCPWVNEHSNEDTPMDTSTVVWEASPGAWPSFHCSHAHCAGRTVREVMALWPDADAHCAGTWAREAAQ